MRLLPADMGIDGTHTNGMALVMRSDYNWFVLWSIQPGVHGYRQWR